MTANGLPEVAIRRLLKNALDADIPDTDDEAYETVEPEVELELTISRPGGTRAVPVTVLAVPTATGNFLFEVFGVRHVVTPDRKVLRRFEIDGRAAWKESSRFAVDPGFVFPERQKAETPRPGAGPR